MTVPTPQPAPEPHDWHDHASSPHVHHEDGRLEWLPQPARAADRGMRDATYHAHQPAPEPPACICMVGPMTATVCPVHAPEPRIHPDATLAGILDPDGTYPDAPEPPADWTANDVDDDGNGALSAKPQEPPLDWDTLVATVEDALFRELGKAGYANRFYTARHEEHMRTDAHGYAEAVVAAILATRTTGDTAAHREDEA